MRNKTKKRPPLGQVGPYNKGGQAHTLANITSWQGLLDIELQPITARGKVRARRENRRRTIGTCRTITAASVPVAVGRGGTTCTSPDSHSDVVLDHVQTSHHRQQPSDQVQPNLSPALQCRGRECKTAATCSTLVLWHIWHEHTYSVTSTS